jgi:hypothetical protein
MMGCQIEECDLKACGHGRGVRRKEFADWIAKVQFSLPGHLRQQQTRECFAD